MPFKNWKAKKESLERRGLYGRERKLSNARNRKYSKNNHRNRLSYNRQYRYGLTPEQVSKIFELQHGMCAICNDRTAVHIDHNHDTGEVRGALCRTCNIGLGMLRDGRLFESARKYLDNPPAREAG